MMITGKKNRKNLADKHRLQTQTYMWRDKIIVRWCAGVDEFIHSN
jgi:hypothetical protein